MNATVLVVAKAPVPGLAKTRVAATVGAERAADLAAASLLDTLDVAITSGMPVVVAMTGELRDAARADEIAAALLHCRVVEQVGDGFGERLANAHAAVDGPVVQVGMDTPQLTGDDLRAAAAALDDHPAALGPADDGGWWVLALRDPGDARELVDVPMSRPDTGALTEAVLPAPVERLRTLRDMDEWGDVVAVAAQIPPTSRVARVAAERTA